MTLRVTPQISEGDAPPEHLSVDPRGLPEPELGDPTEVGVSLSNREIENTVVVNDGETVAIGGLIDETFTDSEGGVPT